MIIRIFVLTIAVLFAQPLWARHNSVDDADVNSSVCRYTNVSSEQAREAILSAFRSHDRDDQTQVYKVNGVRFEGESPEMVLRFMQLTTNLTDKNVPPVDLNKTYRLSGRCKSVRCVLAEMWGASRAEKMLFLLAAYDLNTSPLPYTNADLFTDSELDSILKTIEFVPPELVKVALNQKLTKFSRGWTYRRKPGELLLANATMEFFDPWSDLSDSGRVAVVYHEFAHNIANLGGYRGWDRSPEWFEASGWRTVSQNETKTYFGSYENLKINDFVSEYAHTNPLEDFAETALAYRFAPQRLLKVSPERYEFMKTYIYGGLEFIYAKACQRPIPMGVHLFESPVAIDSTLVKKAVIACRSKYAEMIADLRDSLEYGGCIKSQIITQAFERKYGRTPSMVPAYLFNFATKQPFETKGVALTDIQKVSSGDLLRLCDLKRSKEIDEVDQILQNEETRVGFQRKSISEQYVALNVWRALDRVCPQKESVNQFFDHLFGQN